MAKPKENFDFRNHAKQNKVKNISDIKKQQDNYRVYSTGAFLLDCAIGERDPINGNGGIPERSIVEIFGRNSSFKSGTSLNLAKSVLDADPNNIVIAVFSEEMEASRLEGLDPERFFIYDTFVSDDDKEKYKLAEDHLNEVKLAVQDPNVKLVIIDSIKSLCSSKDLLDKNGSIADLEDTKQLGRQAQLLGNFIKEFKSLNRRAILFMVNQISDNVSVGMFNFDPAHAPKTPAGRYKEYESLIRIETVTKPIYTDKEHKLFGNKLTIGWEVWYKLIKNKYSQKSGNRKAMAKFYFDKGEFDKTEDLLLAASYIGLPEVKQGGGGFWTICGEKVRGFDNVIKLLKEKPEIMKELENKILDNTDKLFSLDDGEVKTEFALDD